MPIKSHTTYLPGHVINSLPAVKTKPLDIAGDVRRPKQRIARGTQHPHSPSQPALADNKQTASLSDAANYYRNLQAEFEHTVTSTCVHYRPLRTSGGTVDYANAVTHTSQILPGFEFLQAASELGRLSEATRCIRHSVFRQWQKQWQNQDHKKMLFFYIHPLELLEPDLFSRYMPLGRIANHVVLEIPLSSALSQIPQLDYKLLELRHLGFRLCLRDVSTTYLSTDNPLWLPDFDYVSLSRECVVNTSDAKATLVRLLIDTCHRTGISVVCDTLHTQAEQRAMLSMGCDIIGEPEPLVANHMLPSKIDSTMRMFAAKDA